MLSLSLLHRHLTFELNAASFRRRIEEEKKQLEEKAKKRSEEGREEEEVHPCVICCYFFVSFSVSFAFRSLSAQRDNEPPHAWALHLHASLQAIAADFCRALTISSRKKTDEKMMSVVLQGIACASLCAYIHSTSHTDTRT